MQERRWRNKYWNPFTTRDHARDRPWFKGLFRCAPMHRWALPHIVGMLELVSRRPAMFGFPETSICVVNTAQLLPSARSRQGGVTVFGQDRGCKTLVVPGSCTGRPFDAVDAKMIVPLIQRSPSMELLYLSKDCQPIAPLIGPQISKFRGLKTIVLVDWDDPVAINKVVMPCKSIEMIDAMCPEESWKNWNNEVAIEAMSELIEMHPRIKGVHATQDFLNAMYGATKFSRCKHNVALIPAACAYSRVFRFFASIGLLYLAFGCGYLGYWLVQYVVPEKKMLHEAVWSVLVLAVFAGGGAFDYWFRLRYGRSWTFFAKHGVMMRRRADRFFSR